MNAPDPIFDDWSEYPAGSREYVFSEKRRCGFAAAVQVAMWASLLFAFVIALSLTIIILVVQ